MIDDCFHHQVIGKLETMARNGGFRNGKKIIRIKVRIEGEIYIGAKEKVASRDLESWPAFLRETRTGFALEEKVRRA